MAIFYPATFDTGQFDYSYFDILNKKFLTMLESHNNIINTDSEQVTLIRETNTIDADGAVINVTETSDTDLNMKIQPITEQDRKLVGRGISVEGYMKAYADRSYDLTNIGDGTRVTVGDIIQRSDEQKYRVETINRFFMSGGEIYRKLLMRKLDG